MSRSETVDVAKLIDERRIGLTQAWVLLLGLLLLLAAGFNLQAMVSALPALAKTWHVPPEALDPGLTARLTGLLLGAVACGPLADQFGRRLVLVAAAGILAAISLLTPLAEAPSMLATLRFFGGLALGGILPSAVALVAEFMPRRARAASCALLLCGFAAGAALGIPATLRLTLLVGWSAPFALDGLVLLGLAAASAALVPESPRFLVLRGSHQEDVATILRKVAPELVLHRYSWFVTDEHRRSALPSQHLFTASRASGTAALWLASAMDAVALCALLRWAGPTLLRDAFTIGLGGVLGAAVLGLLADRLAPPHLLTWAFGAAAIFLALLALGGNGIFGFGAAFCVIGGEIGLLVLAATSYPTQGRATAIAWTLGIGSMAMLLAPRLAAVLPTRGAQDSGLLFAAVAAVSLAAAAMLFLGRLRRARGSEEALSAGPARG